MSTTDPGILDPGLTVEAVMTRHPETVPVFNALGIDTCCGAGASLRDAAAEANLPMCEMLRALADVIGAPE